VDSAAHSPFSLLPPRGSRRTGACPAGLAGTADLPSAVPAGGARASVLSELRARIGALERPRMVRPDTEPCVSDALWQTGSAQVDRLVPLGLEDDSVHEVKACASAVSGASAGAWMTSLGFALRLAVRRAAHARPAGRQPFILWCWPRAIADELGRPSGHGLAQLGLDPAHLVFVETARAPEALGALEEGLRSGALSLAFGILDELDPLPARRLSLAAGSARTPCLAVTHPLSTPAIATATRWRVSGARTAPHPFDPKASGARRFSVALERCRARPQSAGLAPHVVEWSDETLCFRLVAELADRPSRPRRAAGGAPR